MLYAQNPNLEYNQVHETLTKEEENAPYYDYFNIPENYQWIKQIGFCSFASTHLVKQKLDNSKWLIKNTSTRNMSDKNKIQCQEEFKNLQKLDSPYIIKFKEANIYQQKQMIQIIMEYADGGDLQQKIHERKKTCKPFSEDQILDWFLQICYGLDYMHNNKKIVHRDIKPSSIFLTSQNICKIGNFENSKQLQHTKQELLSQVGNPYYMAPEITKGTPYSQQADVWSLGVVLYELCCLKPPFDNWQQAKGFKKVNNNMSYPPITEVTYSKQLKILVSRLLRKDPNERYTIKEILCESLIQNIIRQQKKQPCFHQYIQLNALQNELPMMDRIMDQIQQIRSPQNQHLQQLNNFQLQKNQNIQQCDKKNVILENNTKACIPIVINNQNLQNQDRQQNGLRPNSRARRQISEESKNQSADKKLNLNNQYFRSPQNKFIQQPNDRWQEKNQNNKQPDRNKAIKENIQQIPNPTSANNQNLQNKEKQQNAVRSISREEKYSSYEQKNQFEKNTINQKLSDQNQKNPFLKQSFSQAFSQNKDQKLQCNPSKQGLQYNQQLGLDLKERIQQQSNKLQRQIISQRQNQKVDNFFKQNPIKILKNRNGNQEIHDFNQIEMINQNNKNEVQIQLPNFSNRKYDTPKSQDRVVFSREDKSNEIQATQKVKESDLENIQEQNTHEDLKWLDTPGGDLCIIQEKYRDILAEQNKLADIQYKVEIANKNEIQNQTNQKNKVGNNQYEQNEIKQNQQHQKALTEGQEYPQITRIIAKVIKKPINQSKNPEKQNPYNEANVEFNIKQAEQIPIAPIKKKVYPDQKDVIIQQQNLPNGVTSCQLIIEQKNTSTNLKQIQEEGSIVNSSNEEDIRKISFVRGFKQIESAYQTCQNKQSPQKANFFGNQNEDFQSQTIKQNYLLAQQHQRDNDETYKLNQPQKQFGEKLKNNFQNNKNTCFFKDIQENVLLEQLCQNEPKNNTNFELDKMQIYISEDLSLKSKIQTDLKNYGQYLNPNSEKKFELQDNYCQDIFDENSRSNSNLFYEDESIEQEKEEEENNQLAKYEEHIYQVSNENQTSASQNI
ncbi:hypothetical protein ABPG72_002464 [Tetrahymena utriculariae]